VNWPKPGSFVIPAPTVAVSLSFVYPNKTISTLSGTICVKIFPLIPDEARTCICLDIIESEFFEFFLPTTKIQYRRQLALVFEYWTHNQKFATIPIEIWIDPQYKPFPPSSWSSASPLLLVLCHWRENLDWLQYQSQPYLIYEKRPELRDIANHSTPRNTANEASAYLQFIVDYFYDLPERMLFLHSHRYAYHQQDIVTLLYDLKNAPPEYCNINSAIWGTLEDPDRLFLYNSSHRSWLESYLGPLPSLLLDRCCAQFIVHRDRIRARPLSFYQDALRIALDPSIDEENKEDNRQLGLFFEWLWHYIFGEPPIATPDLEQFVPNITQINLVYYHQSIPSCLRSRPLPELLIASTGGVGTTMLLTHYYQVVGILTNDAMDNDKLKHSVVPPELDSIQCALYIFGDPQDVYKSLERRGFLEDTIKKIAKENATTDDPLALKSHFQNWQQLPTKYPIMFLKYNSLWEKQTEINEYLQTCFDRTLYIPPLPKRRERKSAHTPLPKNLYHEYAKTVQNLPDLWIRQPSSSLSSVL